MLTKQLEKKLDSNCTRMLRAILNKSWKQHPRKQQLYGHQPPIYKTIQIRQTRHLGHCWRSKDKLTSNVLQWAPSHSVGWPTRTYLQHLCTDTGCSLKDLPDTMYDRQEWWENQENLCSQHNIMMIYTYIYIYNECEVIFFKFHVVWMIIII